LEVEPVAAPKQRRSIDPFGGARPREEVLKEKEPETETETTSTAEPAAETA